MRRTALAVLALALLPTAAPAQFACNGFGTCAEAVIGFSYIPGYGYASQEITVTGSPEWALTGLRVDGLPKRTGYFINAFGEPYPVAEVEYYVDPTSMSGDSRGNPGLWGTMDSGPRGFAVGSGGLAGGITSSCAMGINLWCGRVSIFGYDAMYTDLYDDVVTDWGARLPRYTFEFTNVRTGEVVTAVTPEPASLLLLGSGLLGVAVVARRRRKE